MDMITAVRIFAIIHLTVLGISHITAHRAWAEFFVGLRQKGESGVIPVAFMSLGFGSIIAAFHPVWSGVPLALTLLGWAQVVKGALYLAVPSIGMRGLSRVSVDGSRMFIAPGVAFLILSALILWSMV
jgi:hypothetical protein